MFTLDAWQMAPSGIQITKDTAGDRGPERVETSGVGTREVVL
jgi:hypothetical protein